MVNKLKTVKVPPQFEEIFSKSESFVTDYFKQKDEDPTKGTITIAGERYILVRAASMSVGFFKIISNFFRDKSAEEARVISESILFDLAHAIGKADARAFHEKMNLKDPIEKLSAGPIHFAYTGWAFVDIFPESKPSPDENFFLIYDHPYSFESESWVRSGEKTDHAVCIMNAGYSSGWCEESFGVALVASEIMCKAKGDKFDRFIMAHPSKINEYIKKYQKEAPQGVKIEKYEIPGFLNRKMQEEELRTKNKTLEEMNAFMVDRELKMIELKKEIEELKKKSAG
ncbi:MAG: 4-vinyl reductase [Patescibacteria group bacterium]